VCHSNIPRSSSAWVKAGFGRCLRNFRFAPESELYLRPNTATFDGSLVAPSNVQDRPATPSLDYCLTKRSALVGETSARGSGRWHGGFGLRRLRALTVASLARRPLLTCSHNAPTERRAGQKCGMLQRFGSRLDRILVPQPNSAPYANSYRGNLSIARAMSFSAGSPYPRPTVAGAWPQM
jgi:hypothetical protein